MLRKRLGLENDTVQLTEYQPDWEVAFSEEQVRLYETLGGAILNVQHIGSTAVPGLSAKPILDISVAVGDFDEAFTIVEPLAALCYTYRGEHGISWRHYFVKGSSVRGSPRTHHLHVFEENSLEWRNLLRTLLAKSRSGRLSPLINSKTACLMDLLQQKIVADDLRSDSSRLRQQSPSVFGTICARTRKRWQRMRRSSWSLPDSSLETGKPIPAESTTSSEPP